MVDSHSDGLTTNPSLIPQRFQARLIHRASAGSESQFVAYPLGPPHFAHAPPLALVRAGFESRRGLLMNRTHDDRAQMGPTPIWIPLLLTLLVILAIVLNELVLHIVPARGPLAAEFAPDPTSQFVLLAVAGATVAATKLVGWYRGRSADG